MHEKGRDLDKAISTLAENLEEIEETEPDAKEELARVKRGIDEETRAASGVPPEALEQRGQWIRDQITEKEREKKRLIREIGEEQKAEQGAAEKHLELVETRQATSTKLAERKAEIKTHEESITAILETYGTFEQLGKLIATSEEEARKTTEAHDAFLAEYEEKVVTPKRLHQQAQNRLSELEKQISDLRTQIASTLARIEEAAAQGNYSRLADTEIELDWKKRRVEVLKRRAEGAKLLKDLVVAHDKQRSAALSGPIQELVNRWLRLLTEDNYDVLQIDHDLNRPPSTWPGTARTCRLRASATEPRNRSWFCSDSGSPSSSATRAQPRRHRRPARQRRPGPDEAALPHPPRGGRVLPDRDRDVQRHAVCRRGRSHRAGARGWE
ncbi:MAG: hypothetical protein IPK72_25865 [Candidatus Eisenbacteria bacterium]|nr:hypothetical protein [Candidatus Eisenbacteria bacterium]